MDKLEKLFTGFFIVLLVLCIIVFFHYYNKEEKKIKDLNGDGLITKNEIEYHIKKELDKRLETPPEFKGLVKSCFSGFLRGLMMGILVNGYEGAITTGIVLAVINPIMTGIEPML